MKVDFERSMRFHEKELSNIGYNYRAQENYIKIVIQFAKKILEKDSTLSADELKDYIYKSMELMVFYYTGNVDYGGLLAQTRIHEKVLKDNKFLHEEYNRIKDKNIENENCNINFDEDEEFVKKDYIRIMLANMREEKAELKPEEIEAIKKCAKVRNISREMRDSVKLVIPMITGDEISQLKEFMKYNNDFAMQELKDKYVILMIQIGDFFKKFGLLEKYRDINDIELRRIGIEELSYPLNSNKEDKESIGIEDIFEENFLDGLGLEELAILNTFWQNRFAKETKSINEAIFYINTLGLWGDIINGNEISTSDEQVMDAVFLKSKFMEEMSKRIVTEEDGVEKFSIDEDKNERRKICVINDLCIELKSLLGDKYKKYFDNILPSSKNDFYEDLRDTIVLYANKENIYLCKDTAITALLDTFMNSKNIRNWGYMSEISKDGQKSSKSVTGKKYVLIGIDYEGYNMPLRFHMKRQRLEDELIRLTGNTIMPIYEGEEDFWYKNQIVTAQVFMPLDKKHKNAIRKLSDTCSKDSRRYKLIKHLDFIRKSDNFPEHLKIEITDGRKKVKKRDRKYIDIKTGKVYINEGKKYILDDIGNGSYEDDGRS